MRYKILALFTLFLLVCSVAYQISFLGPMWMVFSGSLLLLAIHDASQSKHTILKNFPVFGHLRYLFEAFRPEIQQYFVESDTSADPIPRIYRAMVYQRAKGDLETVPFGTELNVYASDYKWLNHSSFPVHLEPQDFRVTIGGPDCRQPYQAALFNISAMSYGSLSQEAVLALGRGAKKGGFYHNTGEGGLSPHHLASGGDVVWQLGTAYFSARDDQGFFDPEAFRERALLPQVKMIEIKLSQGAKPGHGGVLPGVKVTAEVAAIRRVPIGKTVASPPGHTAFKNPTELCHFVAKLRDLAGGKPVGFKLCIGRREEFIQMCEAMKSTGIFPDFITVDGGEGGTGAAPFDFINYVGSPLKEALLFVDHTLKSLGIRQHLKIIASGKVMSGFDLFEKLALGADLCNSARGMMLSLGCIQAYRCHTNKCPTGVATSDRSLASGLNVADKGERVARFQRRTVESFAELLGAAGLHAPREVALKHISTRHDNRIVTLEELFAHTSELSETELNDKGDRSQGENRPPEPAISE